MNPHALRAGYRSLKESWLTRVIDRRFHRPLRELRNDSIPRLQFARGSYGCAALLVDGHRITAAQDRAWGQGFELLLHRVEPQRVTILGVFYGGQNFQLFSDGDEP